MIIFTNFELPAFHKSVEVVLGVRIAVRWEVVDILAVNFVVGIGKVEYYDG
jgi:hypothetical protein